MKIVRFMLAAVAALAFTGGVGSREASADVFGKCARHVNLETKIASCIAASKLTSYPWVLSWVYIELARAHRQGADVEKAITAYTQSLAFKQQERVRRELEELTLFARQDG